MKVSPLILICDDDPVVHESLGLYLDKEGFAHASAYDGLEALDLLSREHADLIIMDVMMPGLDGVETLKLLRDEKLLVPRIANSISGAILEYFSAYDFKPYIEYVDVFPADVWHLSEKGEGVAFMPKHSSAGYGVPLSPPLYSELYAVWLAKQPMTEHKQALIDYICEKK